MNKIDRDLIINDEIIDNEFANKSWKNNPLLKFFGCEILKQIYISKRRKNTKKN